MELVKFLPVYQYSVDIFFHILVFQEYCALMESRIPFGPGLWAWWLVVAHSISSHEQNQ